MSDEKKSLFQKVLSYLREAWDWIPRLVATIYKTKAGKRFLLSIIAGLLTQVGLDVPPEVVLSVIIAILAEGTLNANDTVDDWKRIARPKRVNVDKIPSPPPSMMIKTVDGRPRPVKWYEVADGRLKFATKDGKRGSVLSPTPEEQRLMEILRRRK